MKIRLRWPATLLAVTLLAAGPAVWALDSRVAGHFDRTLQVNGAVDLDVETGSGSITVRAGSAGTVQIHATISVNDSWHSRGDKDAEQRVHELETNPPVEQNGNTIRVGHVDNHDLTHNISIRYEITVPAETRLRSQTGSGNQTVEGITGPLDASTGSGDLRVTHIGGEVRARTGSGGIELDSVQGNTRASTGSGSIRALGIGGGLVASTGSGDVKLEQTAAGDVEVETGSGEVELNGIKGAARVNTGSGSIHAQGEPTGEWRLRTGSGDLTVRVPEQTAFDLEAHTSSGHIESSHPITVQGTISPRDLRGKVRGGGVLLSLQTSSGSIEIE
jgi:hypothetical protein